MRHGARSSKGGHCALVVGTLGFLLLLGLLMTGPAWSQGVRSFLRGDADGSGLVNVSDAVDLLEALFASGPLPECPDAADTDDDGALNVSDAVFLLGHLFLGGPGLPAPFPESGVDLSPDGLDLAHSLCGVGPDNPTLLRPGASSVAISGSGRIVSYVTPERLLVEDRVQRKTLLERSHRFEILTFEETEVLLSDFSERGIPVEEDTCRGLLLASKVILGVDYLNASLSADGTRLAYELRTWVKSAHAFFQYSSVYIEDLTSGTVDLVSVSNRGDEADATSVLPRISGDGKKVAYLSRAANLTDLGANGGFQVYLRDVERRETEVVSLDQHGFTAIVPAVESPPTRPDISFDGTRIVFATNAYGLDEAGQNPAGFPAIYLRDMTRERTTLVSRPADGRLVDGPSFAPRISDDGRWAVFLSCASGVLDGEELVPGDYAYIYDVENGETIDVLRDPSTGTSGHPGDLSADGTRIVFDVRCDLCPRRHVYLLDRATGRTQVVSASGDGEPGDAPSWDPVISRDGRFVAFSTSAGNLLRSGETGAYLRFVPR